MHDIPLNFIAFALINYPNWISMFDYSIERNLTLEHGFICIYLSMIKIVKRGLCARFLRKINFLLTLNEIMHCAIQICKQLRFGLVKMHAGHGMWANHMSERIQQPTWLHFTTSISRSKHFFFLRRWWRWRRRYELTSNKNVE